METEILLEIRTSDNKTLSEFDGCFTQQTKLADGEFGTTYFTFWRGKRRHYATMVYVKTPKEAVDARRHLENKQQQKQICQCITCIQPKTAEEARQALFH